MAARAAPVYAREVGAFATEQEVYGCIGRLLEDVLADPELAAHFQRADTVLQYRLHEPRACVTVDTRADGVPRVILGECPFEPEVVLAMSGDTAHRFFLGDLNVAIALVRHELEVEGSREKILKLVPLVKPLSARYRELVGAGEPARLVPA